METKLMGCSIMVVGLVVFMDVMINNATPANGVTTCQEALVDVLPCKACLEGSGPDTPSVPCCSGVESVNSQATTTEIRRSLCECFKKAAGQIRLDLGRAKDLPKACKVSLPVLLDPKIDCSTVPLL